MKRKNIKDFFGSEKEEKKEEKSEAEPPTKKQSTSQAGSELQKKFCDWVVTGDNGSKLQIRSFASISDVASIPSSMGVKRGGIRVLKIYNRFAKIDPALKLWPAIPGYERYNVCKNNRHGNYLSPMVLGPVHDEAGELYALNIEDGWQGSKVWPAQLCTAPHSGGDELHCWREWSRRARFSGEARRHRTPKQPGQLTHANANIPLFTFYGGQRLSYKEARERMYMVWYQQLAPATPAYKELKAKHLNGVNLLLLDYDGLYREKPEENCDLNRALLLRLLDDDSRPFGHGLVLAASLLDELVWCR